MELVSVSASILGLLGSAATISEALTHFVNGVKDAPSLALRTLTEIEDLKICFRQLQHFVNAEEARRSSYASMVTVDQFVVVLTHAVVTFSELEVTVEALKPGTASMINGRLRWMAKENIISRLLQRLQASKASMSLLLSTLTCTRLEEAQHATESLTGVVNGVLDATQSIRQRLERSNLSVHVKHQSAPSAIESTITPTEDDASTIRSTRTTRASDFMAALGRNSRCGFAFDPDLRSSPVYSRLIRSINRRRSDPDQLSLPSSAGFSMGSSFLSGVSLTKISNISLLSFPNPLAPVNSTLRSTISQTIWLPRKLALFGISNAGKSTIIKQLQSMQGIHPSHAEMDAAREMILAQLSETFQNILRQDDDTQLQWPLVSERSLSLNTTSSDAEKSNAVLLLQRFWRDTKTKSAIESAGVPFVPDNIAYIVDNIDKILWPDRAGQFDPSLYVHIMTNGLYKSTVEVEPFEYEILDVGGSRSARGKWQHCMDGLHYVIFVADLNAYCQTLREDTERNQLQESLDVYESITSAPHIQNTPILLLLNKTELFEKTITHHPISKFDPNYTGGVDYWKACGYMRDCYRLRNRRPHEKFHHLFVDSLDTDEFRMAWQQVQEKIIDATSNTKSGYDHAVSHETDSIQQLRLPRDEMDF